MYKTTPALDLGHPAQTPAAHQVAMWVTALTVALIPVAFLFGGLAPMAAQDHPQTVAVVTACWWASWTATPLLVVASRLPLHRTAWAWAGYWAGWAAPLPPATTILLTLTL
ncbi:hypothetical protein [Streptomyces sp. NBC_00503]|uniref:hypothetical protein n=1 Tax=Streptomyces sp. NBC_00503 TaxID=2903659 RepID=UPI002E80CF0B|nr:hypothetical protein [Streptomyces sp. NBC_00503]WUD85343.1 hypothetical protein OG490_34920 [Streptomyces sp. NBC_00503]